MPIQLKRVWQKTQRNDLCPCKSGLKFKSCCINAEWVNDFVDRKNQLLFRGDKVIDMQKAIKEQKESEENLDLS